MSERDEKREDLFRAVFDASPTAMLVVDEEGAIQDFNKAAALLVGDEREPVLHKRGGEVMRCLHAEESPLGCGRSQSCKDCLVRGSVNQAFAGQSVFRRTAAMRLRREGRVLLRTFLVSASPFDHLGRRLVLLGLEDVSELLALRRLLPVCSNCKRIRDDQDYWVEMEKYFESFLGADFTHGICPECAKKLYPDLTQGE